MIHGRNTNILYYLGKTMNCTLPEQDLINRMVQHALMEDIGSGDVTANLLPKTQLATATVISREAGVLCGTAWFTRVFAQVDPTITIIWQMQDGDHLAPQQPICELRGPTRAVLTGERVALNFLQTLSGTATTTRQYVNAIAGTASILLDTRKTIPLWRHAQKYAVCCGGGMNHRMGLYDMILIKENHIASAGSVSLAIALARQTSPSLAVEVEVETLDQLNEALLAGATRILLDNMNLPTLRSAVQQTNRRAQLEASGNVTLANIRTIAETGVDFISVGSITKHVCALDLSMRIQTIANR